MTMDKDTALLHIRRAAMGSPQDLEAILRAIVNGDFLTVGGTAVTASAAELNKLDGAGDIVASGTQVSNIAAADNDIAITWTSNDPEITPDGAITIADGDTPTVDELLEFCVELNAAVAALDTKVNAHTAALEAFGIAASS